MIRKNSESLQQQRERNEQRKVDSLNNNKEKVNACLEEDFEHFQEEAFEKEQIKNVYINTFYFFILSLLFGLAYLFINLNK